MSKLKLYRKYNRIDTSNLTEVRSLEIIEQTNIFRKTPRNIKNVLPKKRKPLQKSHKDKSTLSFYAKNAKISEHLHVAKSFKYLDVDFRLRQVHKFRYPRPLLAVEKLAWPSLLAGRDMLLQAPFLKGQTLAYLIPLLQCAIDMRHRRYPSAVILCKSDNFARWIFFTAKSFASHAGLSGLLLNSDSFRSSLVPALPDLFKPARTDFIVASETAFLKLLCSGELDLGLIQFLAIDELHLFQHTKQSLELITLLFARLPRTRQVVCCCPKNSVEDGPFMDVVLDGMATPVQIKIKDDCVDLIKCKQFIASYLIKEKFQALYNLVQTSPSKKTIVFCKDLVNALHLQSTLSDRAVESVLVNKYNGRINVRHLRRFKDDVNVLISMSEIFPTKHFRTEHSVAQTDLLKAERVIMLDPPQRLWEYALCMSAIGEGEGYTMVNEMDQLEEGVSQYVSGLPRVIIKV